MSSRLTIAEAHNGTRLREPPDDVRSMSMIEQELEDLEEAGAAWNLKWDGEHQVCFHGQKKMEHTEYTHM